MKQKITNTKTNLGQTNYSTRPYVLTLHEEQLIQWKLLKLWPGISMATIASLYGLDSLGLNPGGDKILHSCLDQPWGPTSILYNGYQTSYPGVKRLGCVTGHPPPSSGEVEERVISLLPSRP